MKCYLAWASAAEAERDGVQSDDNRCVLATRLMSHVSSMSRPACLAAQHLNEMMPSKTLLISQHAPFPAQLLWRNGYRSAIVEMSPLSSVCSF